MKDEADTFAAAVRGALLESDTIDMRQVARQAAQRLAPELVLEAAVTHLAKLARHHYNANLKGQTDQPTNAAEVVYLRGTDTVVRNLQSEDREWVAKNREGLADGLRQSADRIRNGPYAAADEPIVAADVARIERRAMRLRAATKSLEELLASADDVITNRHQAATNTKAKHDANIVRYQVLARRAVTAWQHNHLVLSRWTRTKHAIEDLSEVTHEGQAPEAV